MAKSLPIIFAKSLAKGGRKSKKKIVHIPLIEIPKNTKQNLLLIHLFRYCREKVNFSVSSLQSFKC